MDESTAVFLAKQQRETEAFRKPLSAESDRGCALFAAAYLDSSLSDLLYVSLVAKKKIESDLFDGTNPLMTFSSRIKMAYYLGLSPSLAGETLTSFGQFGTTSHTSLTSIRLPHHRSVTGVEPWPIRTTRREKNRGLTSSPPCCGCSATFIRRP
jgi:hypothetical protein